MCSKSAPVNLSGRRRFGGGFVFMGPRLLGRGSGAMRELADHSGLQLSGISYKLDPWRDEPLRRLAVEVRVEGPFNALLNFAHELETTKDFVMVENCNVQGHQGESLAMRLTAGMYLEP